MVKYNNKIHNSTGTDIVVQLVLSFLWFIKRCGEEVRDGDTTACGDCNQEDYESSALVQGECEQMPLTDSDPGQVHLTPVHTNTLIYILCAHAHIKIFVYHTYAQDYAHMLA